jgi:hypothetical protein
MEVIMAYCPICGTEQRVENRECNQCFVEFVKGIDGTVSPPSRRFFVWVDDKDDMNEGIFNCQTCP